MFDFLASVYSVRLVYMNTRSSVPLLQLLKDMDLQHSGGIGEMEFVHAISKVPEFGTTFSFRL